MIPWLALAMTIYILVSVGQWVERHRGNEAFASGFSLLAVVAALFGLSVRKRMIDRPLGSVAIWQAVHHYLGMLCLAIYAMHAGLVVRGWLEIALAIAFWIVSLSGLVSWYVNRTSPRLLRAAGYHVLREDIPQSKQLISEQAYRLALEAAGKNETAALADYYRAKLSAFFMKPRSMGFRVFPTGMRRRNLVAGLESLDRYLSETGRESRRRMCEFVISKDNLDFQYAIQLRIRVWAAMHTAFIGSFLVLTIAHVILAFRYSSHW